LEVRSVSTGVTFDAIMVGSGILWTLAFFAFYFYNPDYEGSVLLPFLYVAILVFDGIYAGAVIVRRRRKGHNSLAGKRWEDRRKDMASGNGWTSRAVLITGCSSGIGRATAERLADRGWTVYATARDVEAIAPLGERGCRLLPLDVTDEESMRRAVEEVERAEGAVGVLVNNAGYSQSGAVEEVPMEKVRRQFETNVFGLVRMCQLVLPGMRGQGFGRIVNLSSMGGRLTFPGGGFYHASKYAVEAISDSLRFEVRGFGVEVVVIEPGLIRTGFAETALSSMDDGAEPSNNDPYAGFEAGVARATRKNYERGPLARLGGGPEAVAETVERAISSARPRTRYTVTPSAKLLISARRLLPDRAWDGLLHFFYPQPGVLA
jgi:NAD(P)-dependent dehydrogenase (short-subunit alcohol dehydrogenase family)